MKKYTKKVLYPVLVLILLIPIISCDTSTFPEPPSFIATFYGTTFQGMELQLAKSDSTTFHIACPINTSFLSIEYESAYSLSITAYVKDLDTNYTCTQNGLLNFSLGKYTQPTNTTPGYWSGTITFMPDSGKAWGGNFHYYVSYYASGAILLFDQPIKLPVDNEANKYFNVLFFSTDFILSQGCQ